MKRIAFLLMIATALPAFAEGKGSWKLLAPTPSVRTEVAVVLNAGKVYLIGGFTPQGPSGCNGLPRR